MLVVIGSKRTPKVNAVKSAFLKMAGLFPVDENDIEYESIDTPSGIVAMPLSITELTQGARNRALYLVEQFGKSKKTADYFVGLEGGFFHAKFPDSNKAYFLQGWVFISNGIEGYFGASAVIPVPQVIVHDVVEHGKELGDVIDNYDVDTNIRNKEGAFGVFSRGLVTREATFESAVVHAMAPFYNKKLYAKENDCEQNKEPGVISK